MSSFSKTPYPLIINGEEVKGSSETLMETRNPATGEVIGHVYEATEADVDQAVHAASTAYESHWRKTTPKERSRRLLAFAEAIRRREEALADAETADVGRPISATSQEMTGVADSVDYYAGVVYSLGGETPEISDPTLANMTFREPLGVCGLIVPWNYPALLAVLKMAPAIAAGNTVILKPSELTPISTALLGEAALEAGFPPGVVNILHGRGDVTGAALVRHPDVAKISYTGGTTTGKRIFEASAATVKRLTLELGGKSPLIVFDDTDIDAAVSAAVRDNTRHAGQVCAACSRLIVQDSIMDEFVAKLEGRLGDVKVGLPSDPETEMGPLISGAQRERVKGYIESARQEGADVRTYVELSDRPELSAGYFLPPTLLLSSTNEMTASREEIFGPVQSVISFRDESHAVQLANDSPYGLAAAVYTGDASRAMRVTRDLKAGTVCINASHKVSVDSPFGGCKQSGFGKERGIAAMLDDTTIKSVRHSLL